jgi:hypothetical protein
MPAFSGSCSFAVAVSVIKTLHGDAIHISTKSILHARTGGVVAFAPHNRLLMALIPPGHLGQWLELTKQLK